MCQARMSEAFRNVLPSVGFLRRILCATSVESVLVRLFFCHFLNIELDRIVNVFSDMLVNYK